MLVHQVGQLEASGLVGIAGRVTTMRVILNVSPVNTSEALLVSAGAPQGAGPSLGQASNTKALGNLHVTMLLILMGFMPAVIMSMRQLHMMHMLSSPIPAAKAHKASLGSAFHWEAPLSLVHSLCSIQTPTR